MEHNFPCPITGEKDLKYYEDYLKKSDNRTESRVTVERASKYNDICLTDTAYMPAFLNTMVGKLVRVESLIGGCLENRIGILLNVGADYIVLKLYRCCSTMICEASSIKYITVIHDNDLNKSGLF